MISGLAESNGALDQQSRVFRFRDDVTRLVDKHDLLGYHATSSFATVAFVGESNLYVHFIVGKEGCPEADLVPTERCDRGVLVQLDFTFESFHQGEAV